MLQWRGETVTTGSSLGINRESVCVLVARKESPANRLQGATFTLGSHSGDSSRLSHCRFCQVCHKFRGQHLDKHLGLGPWTDESLIDIHWYFEIWMYCNLYITSKVNGVCIYVYLYIYIYLKRHHASTCFYLDIACKKFNTVSALWEREREKKEKTLLV